MEKYVASTPDAEVLGAALMAYQDTLTYDQYRDILARYNLLEIEPEKWYPQQLTLDIQKAIRDGTGGSTALVSIGMRIIDAAKFPPMESIEQALEAFASSYPMNFRNQSEDDLIHAKITDLNSAQIINGSPHSDEMIYGYIYALIRRFAPEGSRPSVKFADIYKIDGDEDTVFEVKW